MNNITKEEWDTLINKITSDPNYRGPLDPEWAEAHAAMGFATPSYEVLKEIEAYDDREVGEQDG